MTTKKTVQQTYGVSAKVTLEVSIPITAASFEDAAAKASLLEVSDFVEVQGELYDSEKPQIRSIYLND
jgi:hypothetical protein